MLGNFSPTYKRLLLLLACLCCFLLGVILLLFNNRLFSIIINSQLVIAPGTAAYNAWIETPIPIYTKFYFFDMLNPRDLFHNHEKPILEQRGPYTFREIEKKVNLTWHSDGTVSYRRAKSWYFEREMSVGPLTDTVTTINVPVVGSAQFAQGDFFMEWGISDMLSTLQARIFIKRTIGELLFEGYEDSVMEMASISDGEEEEYDFFEAAEEEEYAVKEEASSGGKFGWFYQRNGTSTSDGDLRMHTGAGDISQLGSIVEWNHNTRTEAFPGKCGRIEGSSDGLFPPGDAENRDTLAIFSTDLCRKLQFSKETSPASPHEVHGIPAEKFELSPTNFANSSVCSDNSCYNNNIPSGVQNVTTCKMKSPAFISRPHFHLADPYYQQQFQYGVQPLEGVHDSALWIEPKSSIPLKVEMRLQLNILLDKVEGIEYLFKNLPRVMFPVFWFEGLTELPEEMAGSLQMLVLLPKLMQGCGYFSCATGIFIFILICIMKVRDQSSRKQKANPKLEQSIIKKQKDFSYTVVPSSEATKKSSIKL